MTLQEDFVPTVLDITGQSRLAKGVTFDGVSLKRYFTETGRSPRSEFYITECTWMRKHGWRTPIWKFWDALEPDFHGKPPVELYNLLEDPKELRNLAEKEPGLVKTLRDRMNAWLKKRCRATGKGNPIELHQIGLDRRIGSIETARKLQKR